MTLGNSLGNFFSDNLYRLSTVCTKVRKDQMYEDLSDDIINNGFKCNSLQLEVGVRGFINARNKGILTHIAFKNQKEEV